MILKAIRDRRSVRKYKPTPVTKEQLKVLLEAAMLAPSACNSRPWRFIAITDRAVLDRLSENHGHAKMLAQAPAAIVICALPEEQAQNKVAEGFWPQDCGAATQNILLQAREMGLSTCWCGVYPKEHLMPVVREILSLPDEEIPFCLIAVGEGDDTPDARGFYDEDRVRWL